MPKTLVVLLALLLASCGGGAHPIDVALYGDSLTSGGLLAVKPAQRIQAALGEGYAVHDYSAAGTNTASALDGDARQLFSTLPEQVRLTHPAVTAILYGANDTVAGAVDPQFEGRLRVLVGQTEASDARVVLATLIHIPAADATLRDIDAVIRRVAADTGSVLADVAALPQGTLVDGVHPDQAYSDARAALIASAIRNASPSP